MSTSPKKMSTNQEVSGGFDLTSFVGGADRPSEIALKASKTAPGASKRSEVGKVPPEPQTPPREALKPEQPLLTERVQVRLSKAEVETLQEKIGMVPVSTYLRKLLKDSGLIG